MTPDLLSKAGKDIMDHIKDTRPLSRRDILKLSSATLGGVILAACTPKSTTEVPFPTPTPDNRMDNLSPDPNRFSTRKILEDIESMSGLSEEELKSLESRAVTAAEKIGVNLYDDKYDTNLLGIKLRDNSRGEINHVFISRTLKANAPEPTVGPTSNQADQAGLYFLVDVDPPYFVPPGEGSSGDARMFPVVGYEISNGFALGLGTPNPDGQTYTVTFGFCSIEINKETLKATKVTYVDPYSGRYKIYDPNNIPSEIESMYTKVLPINVASKTEAETETKPQLEPLDLGDARYNQEIIKQKYPWKLEGDQLFVDWKKDGNYELAFEKVGDKWEIRKFVLKREDVDISSMTCRKIYDLTSKVDTNCIQEDSKLPSSFYIKFKPGNLVWEARKDKDGNILPGSIIYTYAHTRRMPGSPEEVIKIVLQVDYGDGMNQTSFKARDQAVSIFEMNELFPTTREVTYSFRKKWLEGVNEYYDMLNEYVNMYNDYYLGTYFSPDLLFFPNGSPDWSLY